MIGTKLAHYQITAHLGSGGMGEVYQATDAKLGRSVALKLLPEAFNHDHDRAARFEREARVLASLNHPNIAAIHGIEEVAGRKFLVMELVLGETLAERIRRGPMPVDEALPLARQIADGLEAAHEKGIIHRDLKPANIKISPQGQMKVLDFGLAKAFAGEASGVNLSNSPTMMSATIPGMILGTAAYMSPEQAKGKETDRTTDIWAFGCVLYEMLTGRTAFEGETLAEILGGVMKAEPDWSQLPAGTPASITRMLRRALKKDPRQRLGDIRDARIEIEEALAEPPAATMLATLPARSSSVAWIVAAAAVLAALVLAVPAVRYLRETEPPLLPEIRTAIETPAAADPTSFALSPDGRQIVFVASGDGVSRLWLRSLESTAVQPLAGTEGALDPFWSPDSRSVGFIASGKLKRLDIGGGSPQTLAVVNSARGGTWNAAGVILFNPSNGTGSPLFRIPASGSEEAVAVMTKTDAQTNPRYPFFLPDGRQFLFLAYGAPEAAGIYLGSLDSSETRRLTPADSAGVYLSSGWLLWVRAGALVAQRLDLEQRMLTGDTVTLADPVVFGTDFGSGAAVSVSAAGLVAYRAGVTDRRQLARFDRSGKAPETMGAPDENGLNIPTVSPDGRRVAVHRTVEGNTDIFLLDGTRSIRFTTDAGLDRNPVWSPDGSRIVFSSNRKGHVDLFQKSSGGAGLEDLLWESQQDKFATDWSADSRFILYHSLDPKTGRDLWVLPMEGDRTPWLFLATSYDERFGQFSPNGQWVAYTSNESGRPEVYIRPFAAPAAPGATANPAAVWPVSTTGGANPRWRPDGRELYYLGPNGEMMAAPITATGTTLEAGAPVVLFPTRIVGGGSRASPIRQYDVARDGRFLINTVLDDLAPPIILLQNWSPEPVGQ